MIKKLLLIAALAICGNICAQTVANTAPDIEQCNPNIFQYTGPPIDLTLQTPIILGNQDPENFTVTYHNTLQSAEAGTNAIENITAYNTYAAVPSYETIYARVTNNNNSEYAVSSFHVTEISIVAFENTMILCDGYDLPSLNIGNYYSEPGGQGTVYQGVVPQFTHLYVYAEYNGCVLQYDYIAYPDFVQFEGPLDPINGCDSNMDGIALYNLSSLALEIQNGQEFIQVGFYHTYDDAEAGVNEILNLSAYYNTIPFLETIYVRRSTITCHSVTSVDLIAGECEGSSVAGNVKYDYGFNGCTENAITATGVQVIYNTGESEFISFTDALGNYGFANLPEVEGTISINSGNVLTYTATPQQYTFTPTGEEIGYDFCISASNPVNDVTVTFSPLNNAIPGFTAEYQLTIQNTGAFPASGNVTVAFDDSALTFLSATPAMTQSGTMLNFNYTNLMPFQSQSVNIQFEVFTPPTVNGGDLLIFIANLTESDDGEENNTAILNQTVVNSFDPNDLTVHEGESITAQQAEGYLHYTIRFQNEGNGNAINIRVDGMLDENLDWSTFQPIVSSHSTQTTRDGNQIQFYFNNINLPFTDADEPGSHGFISYRIKPLNTIQIGDVISASAAIYFDFNPAVLTNTATTTIQEVNGSESFVHDSFIIYPNPANGNITLKVNLTDSAEVNFTDVLGKNVLSVTILGNKSLIDISSLNSGMYFVQLTANGKSVTKKLMVK